MAESFVCGGKLVFMSTTATELLFECWERLARAASGRPGMADLASYLRRSLDEGWPGGRAFGMDREYLPDELAGPAELAALLEVIEQTAADPTLVRDVNWSPELVVWWQVQLTLIGEALRATAG